MKKILISLLILITMATCQTPDGTRKTWHDTIMVSSGGAFVDIMTIIPIYRTIWTNVAISDSSKTNHSIQTDDYVWWKTGDFPTEYRRFYMQYRHRSRTDSVHLVFQYKHAASPNALAYMQLKVSTNTATFTASAATVTSWTNKTTSVYVGDLNDGGVYTLQIIMVSATYNEHLYIKPFMLEAVESLR